MPTACQWHLYHRDFSMKKINSPEIVKPLIVENFLNRQYKMAGHDFYYFSRHAYLFFPFMIADYSSGSQNNISVTLNMELSKH